MVHAVFHGVVRFGAGQNMGSIVRFGFGSIPISSYNCLTIDTLTAV